MLVLVTLVDRRDRNGMEEEKENIDIVVPFFFAVTWICIYLREVRLFEGKINNIYLV